jgi:capsular polysaccharide biosynthesis protein
VHQPAPGLRDYLHVLLRQGWLVLLVAACAVAASLVVSSLQDDRYRAEATLVVQRGATVAARDDAAVKTLAELARSDVVLQNVIANLRRSETPEELRQRVHVRVKEGTALLEIAVDDRDRQSALRIVQEIALVFAQLVKERFAATTAADAPAVTVFDPAHADAGRAAPRTARNALVALALGLLLGVLAALLRAAPEARIRRADAERLFGAPVVTAGGMRERVDGLGLSRPLQTIVVSPVAAGDAAGEAAAIAQALGEGTPVVAHERAPGASDVEIRGAVRRLAAGHDHVVVAGPPLVSEESVARIGDAVVVVLGRGTAAADAAAAREALAGAFVLAVVIR